MKKIVVSMLFVAALLTGCGSSSKSSATTNSFAVSESAYDTSEYGIADYASEDSSDFASQSQAVTGEKLVYSGSVSIETLDFETTMHAINEQIAKFDGIIQSSNQSNSNYRWYDEDSVGYRSSNMTLRIPTKNFSNFLTSLEGTGHISNQSQNVENITKQYQENSVEIESLKTQEARLLEMMEQAETVEDLITIDARLSDVQTQLTKRKNQQASMDTDVEYSTIDLYVEEVRKYTEVSYEQFPIHGFGEKLKEALDTSWRFCVWAIQNIVLLIIEILPIGLVLGLVGYFISKLLKKRKEKKNAKKDIKQEETK